MNFDQRKIYMIFNIYKIPSKNTSELNKKISSKGLEPQKKNVDIGNFNASFYISRTEGNTVPWWKSYEQYILPKTPEVRNVFNCGLLMITPKESKGYSYAVTLGNASLFLRPFIEKDFGINVALRMANEDSVLLKKSTYHNGIKKGDASQYIEFKSGNYEPGESVDYLKLKAEDINSWGDNYIECSDSIKINYNISPEKIYELLDKIEATSQRDFLIKIPQTRSIKERKTIELLDKELYTSIVENEGKFSLTQINNINGSLTTELIGEKFKLGIKKKYKQILQDILEADQITDKLLFEYIHKNCNQETGINDIVLQYTDSSGNEETERLKNLIEFSTQIKDNFYILKNGEWKVFNDTFMDHIKKSVDSIPHEIADELDDNELQEYIKKKSEKKSLEYREYNFNCMMSERYGYKLFDRKNKYIENINGTNRRHPVELSDLYNESEGELISVKIGDSNPHLIYNIKQSSGAIELLMNGALEFDQKIKIASLWFVLEKKIEKITLLDKILVILAIDEWKKYIINMGLTPKIYISHHKIKKS